jgi:2,4-dienoyl-CoA reductase-like NADH-dependent reductase (Old Yellow Enzyme family)/thioredoxin reductase
MTRYQNVFSPFKFANVEVKNRIEVSPMLCCMATPDGYITRELIEFYQTIARGGAGIVTVGDVVIDTEYAPGHMGQMSVGDDRIVGGLSTLVESIQKYGAKASIELNHAGRRASPRVLRGKNPISASSIWTAREEIGAKAEGRKRAQVQAMTQDMIDQVIENFANACYRCMKAGFEMVMLHGGHGHLLAQYVSPYTNKRNDNYGGSLENRARFVIEVLTAIRKKVGNNLALEYRISGDEYIAGGLHEGETIEFVKMIQDKIDLLHVSLGTVDTQSHSPYMIQPTYFPNAHNLDLAARIKKAINIPLTCMGSIMNMETAEKALAAGKADIVAMARAILADPEIVNKTYYGRMNDIRPCLRCGSCTHRISNFYPVRCAVNPVAGREVEYGYIRPADHKKKVFVIGGGPAGMEAALTAASRGHSVTLFEKQNKLGGALQYAAGPPFKTDMKVFMEWLVEKTMSSAVEVRLSTEATPRTLKQAKPDVLIIAIGAQPVIPEIPGTDKTNVVWAGDVDVDRVKTGKTVIVAGAGLTGCETALYLAQQGKDVTIIDMIPEVEIAKDAASVLRFGLLELLHENGVKFKTEVKLEEITDRGALIIDKKWERYEILANTVVLSLGFKTPRDTVRALKDLVPESYVIGDCANPRNLMAAIHDGFNITVEL